MSLEASHKIEEWKEQIRNFHRYSIKDEKRKSYLLLYHLDKITHEIIQSDYEDILNLMYDLKQTLDNVSIQEICLPSLIQNLSFLLSNYFVELVNSKTSHQLETVCIQIMCYLTMNEQLAKCYSDELLYFMGSRLKDYLKPTQMTIFLLRAFGNLLTYQSSRELMREVLEMINIEHVLFFILLDINNQTEEFISFQDQQDMLNDLLLWFLHKYTNHCLNTEDKSGISHHKLEQQLLVYFRKILTTQNLSKKYYTYISSIIVSAQLQVTISFFQTLILQLFSNKWECYETASLFLYFSHYYEFPTIESYLGDILYMIASEEQGYKYKKRNQLFLRGVYNFFTTNKNKAKIWNSTYTSEYDEILSKKDQITEELNNLKDLVNFSAGECMI